MLCLKIASPAYLIIKFIIMLFKELNSLCVGDPAELGIHYVLKSVKKSLVNELVEESHFFGCMLKSVSDDIFEHILSYLHVIGKLRKSDLGLDHPELRGMTCSI